MQRSELYESIETEDGLLLTQHVLKTRVSKIICKYIGFDGKVRLELMSGWNDEEYADATKKIFQRIKEYHSNSRDASSPPEISIVAQYEYAR